MTCLQKLLVATAFGLSAAATSFAESPDIPALSVLEKNCLECHGGKTTRSGLDLSTHETLLKGGESGERIVVAGKPEASLLYKKVTHAHSPGMPFKREKLAEADIQTLKTWITAGATYSRPLDTSKFTKETFWSLKPLAPVDVPKPKNKSWAKTPIDNFILAKLEEKNMKPSAPTDKRTLLRRATFDLTGLPPTPEEMQAFLKDKSRDAFAKVVDRLLASPRYGERWARHWLDVVHYGDSHGHDEDRPRPNAWPYRDYVIKAFNDDKPYARFVEEQLAGDVLYPEDPNGIIATGFISAGPWDESSLMQIMDDTVDKKVARYLDRDDMVMTTISTFVSTTVHCARCHNHKFDPIPQMDYYNLQACFAGVDRAERPYDTDPKINLQRQQLLRKKLALEVKDKRFYETLLGPEMQTQLAAWEKSFSSQNIWTVLSPETFTSSAGATLTKQKDLSLLASGIAPLTDTYTITAQTDLKNITAIRLEVMTDTSHPRNGPGRQPENGNFHLSEFRATAAPKENAASAKALALQNPSADFNQESWGVEKTIDGDTNTAWGIFPETGKPHYAVFELKENAGFDGGTTLTFTLAQLHGREHTLLRPRISITTSPRPVKAERLPDNIKTILAIESANRSHEQKIELAVFYLKGQIDKELAALPKPKMVYAAANDFPPAGKFTPAKIPRPIFLLKRGDVSKEGDPAIPGALSCMTNLPPRFELSDANDEGARRAALAKWITDSKNFLTWRSIANRVWHYHFGRGLVETPNDFGQMGGRPSHAELLDWLAISFRDSGGSLKKLHRLILTSAVYQQSSEDNPRYATTDSGNLLLWRMNRARLDAESLRDGVLQITGKLDLKMGGPPAKQFYSEDLVPNRTPIADYNRFDVDSPEALRRSVYRYLFRTVPDPFMDALDCADSSQLTPVRNLSMTALQALAMWNDAFVVRQSEHFATKVAGSGPLREQIKKAYGLALNREPTSRELKELEPYAKKHGMANTCRLLLNSNEFLFLN
ncbi:MAG: Protein of unknown function (DUF1553)/Protein of unknown function (DUF1549)/Planctomycete [Verrucomicrobiales bacterium]|nr:Protein of unknown function (DUF1553)/Protein of unknown function (DUF1549)/Planctomycete [Verrucomicrobiales bacterium]